METSYQNSVSGNNVESMGEIETSRSQSHKIGLIVAITIFCGALVVHSRGAEETTPLLKTFDGYKEHSYGTGSSATMKHTWPASNPVSFAAFMLAVFPTSPWLVGNESWVDNNCAVWGKVLMGNQTDSTFQLHTVSAPVRSDGGLSLPATEAAFSSVVDKAIKAGEFTPLLDYNVGFYTEDLDFYAERFRCGGVKFLTLEWASAADSSTTYFSLLVHVPGSLAVIELMGETLTTLTADLATGVPRLSSSFPPAAVREQGSVLNGRPLLYAVKLSYATSAAAQAAAVYEDVLQAESLGKWEGHGMLGLDGVSSHYMLGFPMDSARKAVEVHFWQHSAANDDSALTVDWLDGGMTKAHQATHIDDTTGFDQWNDWHYGHRLGTSAYLDDYMTAAEDAGLTYTVYTDYSTETNSWAYYMYLATPSGPSVQLVGNFSKPALIPDEIRVFDTCWSEGGFTFESKDDVAALFADREYMLHPDWNRLGSKLQHSEFRDQLDDCQSIW